MLMVKRVYEAAEPGDGTRFLVERLWLRGMKKESLRMTAWLKEVAPSDALRRWFGHEPAKWDEFRRRYFGRTGRRTGDLAAYSGSAATGGCNLALQRSTMGSITTPWRCKST